MLRFKSGITLVFLISCFSVQVFGQKSLSKPIQHKKTKKVVVEIWSDIVCPWCYIGKREFEKALSQFSHKEDVEIIWKSFELDPNAPKEQSISSYEMLAKKYGVSKEKSIEMHQNVANRATQIGLTYNMDKIKLTNSFDGHRLLQFAKTFGKANQIKEKLCAAYFTEGKQISSLSTLVEIGVSEGLPADEITRMLESDAFETEVREDEKEARTLSITGVPFFVINRKYGISGGQTSQVFLENLNQIWAESPSIKEESGAVCTPEGECK